MRCWYRVVAPLKTKRLLTGTCLPTPAGECYQICIRQCIRACSTPFYVPFKQIICLQKPLSATEIPQRSYGQGSAIPDGAHPRQITFATVDCSAFPLCIALAESCDPLVDAAGEVFMEQTQTINLRIEVFDTSVIPSYRSSHFRCRSGRVTKDGEHR